MFECLDVRANASDFAALMGVTQQHIGHLRKQNVLEPDGTYRTWLLAYAQHMQRVHGQSSAYSLAKTREMEANWMLKHIQIAQRIEEITGLYQRYMDAWATQTRVHVLAAGDRILHNLSMLDLDVGADEILIPLRNALQTARIIPAKLLAADDPGESEPGCLGADTDSAMDGATSCLAEFGDNDNGAVPL